MVTLNQLFERAGEWLKDNNQLPLNSDEIVYLLSKTVGILSRGETGKTYNANSINELEKDIVISFAINFVRLRKLWTLPKVLTWRGREIKPSMIQ